MLLRSFYDQIILKYSKTVLLLILLGVAFLGYEARKLEIDASSETLLLEDDKDLEYTRLINQRYYTPDFLVVSYTPSGDLLSDRVLETVRNLSKDLEQLDRVESVTSILNVPLLESPPSRLPNCWKTYRPSNLRESTKNWQSRNSSTARFTRTI